MMGTKTLTEPNRIVFGSISVNMINISKLILIWTSFFLHNFVSKNSLLGPKRIFMKLFVDSNFFLFDSFDSWFVDSGSVYQNWTALCKTISPSPSSLVLESWLKLGVVWSNTTLFDKRKSKYVFKIPVQCYTSFIRFGNCSLDIPIGKSEQKRGDDNKLKFEMCQNLTFFKMSIIT